MQKLLQGSVRLKLQQTLQKFCWKTEKGSNGLSGSKAQIYTKRGYDVAAFLLEHSLESIASNLHFSQSHWVTQKIMRSSGFQDAYRKLEETIKQDPDVYAASGKMEMNFQETGDTDLYLGIGSVPNSM